LFLEGANEDVLQRAAVSGADVLIQELEDFTPPALRPVAHALAPDLYRSWREAGAVVAVRINPLQQGGMDDLAAVMRGRLDVVALPKVASRSMLRSSTRPWRASRGNMASRKGRQRCCPI
jgi:citrate lyase subunit beta/citryl-CoA lyase